jgi:hypothetical protein
MRCSMVGRDRCSHGAQPSSARCGGAHPVLGELLAVATRRPLVRTWTGRFFFAGGSPSMRLRATCGGRLRFIVTNVEPPAITKILDSLALASSPPLPHARSGSTSGLRPGAVGGVAAGADGSGFFAAGKRGDASVRLPIALTASIRADSIVTASAPCLRCSATILRRKRQVWRSASVSGGIMRALLCGTTVRSEPRAAINGRPLARYLEDVFDRVERAQCERLVACLATLGWQPRPTAHPADSPLFASRSIAIRSISMNLQIVVCSAPGAATPRRCSFGIEQDDRSVGSSLRRSE